MDKKILVLLLVLLLLMFTFGITYFYKSSVSLSPSVEDNNLPCPDGTFPVEVICPAGLDASGKCYSCSGR